MEEEAETSRSLSQLHSHVSCSPSEINKTITSSDSAPSVVSDLCNSFLGLVMLPMTQEVSENSSQTASHSRSDANSFMLPIADSKYKQSIGDLSSAFNNAVATILLFVEERICYQCIRNCPSGIEELRGLVSFLPPMVAVTLLERVLLKASHSGKGHALVHLLAMGVNGDCTDGEKRNALHLACMTGFDNCVCILLDFKSISRSRGRVTARAWDPKTDFEALDVYLKTPLDYAKQTMGPNACAFYIEKAIEAKQNKRVKIKKKS